jgi:hypothetical protein
MKMLSDRFQSTRLYTHIGVFMQRSHKLFFISDHMLHSTQTCMNFGTDTFKMLNYMYSKKLNSYGYIVIQWVL